MLGLSGIRRLVCFVSSFVPVRSFVCRLSGVSAVCLFAILLPLFLYLTHFHVTGHSASIFWFILWYNGTLLCGVP